MEVDLFKHEMYSTGLSTKAVIVPDGKLHRFYVEGDRQGSLNGWYVFYVDGLAAGAFGSWKTGNKYIWCIKADHNLSHTERIQFKQRMEEIKSVREAEEIAKRKVARDKALYIWENSSPAPDSHLYLVRKKVRNHGLRINKKALIIPIRDNVGQLHSLQFIDADGNKRFLSGGRKKGCYFVIGNPIDILCICEGYATAASIHDATGSAVAVAFDAGNLKSVALALRSKFPQIEITLCADNDADSPVNIGLNKAREAAMAVSASLAIPPITGDFNDLFSGGRHA
ncbi:MAG: hypothetical protein A3J37_07260 [Alphaproteobacteria bacterium RIFCSPHIGHO2_12_FULL_45_9]|nr:MAG: hypothetical protein A3B66_04770 [Alphaproteobacteria bacterium RIFCSPHIGHO2_02_FULL_46_13]OFW96859.1 MAG: hypothetical protein A3J37_07260 [Alphaproteobacteria bacterium RIFCSPHIGHO2_12_FULL_45_9]